MTQIISFAPAGDENFRFNAAVNGNALYCTVVWNCWSNRYYIRAKDQTGSIVFDVPFVSSPDDYDINLALPFRPGKIVYRASTNNIEIS